MTKYEFIDNEIYCRTGYHIKELINKKVRIEYFHYSDYPYGQHQLKNVIFVGVINNHHDSEYYEVVVRNYLDQEEQKEISDVVRIISYEDILEKVEE